MCLSNYKFVNLAQFYQNRIGNDIQFIAIAANYNVTDIVLEIIYTILSEVRYLIGKLIHLNAIGTVGKQLFRLFISKYSSKQIDLQKL